MVSRDFGQLPYPRACVTASVIAASAAAFADACVMTYRRCALSVLCPLTARAVESGTPRQRAWIQPPAGARWANYDLGFL